MMNKPVLMFASIANKDKPVNSLDLFKNKDFLDLDFEEQFETLMDNLDHDPTYEHCKEPIIEEI